MRLESGSRLGPYEISDALGVGGMGEVYRARDTRLGREVAIKVLPREMINNRDRLARFEREARSASALNHRNIVTIHDFTLQDDEAWLVMELIQGESLRDLIARGPLPLKKLLSIANGIADGLAAAHAAGLVHRDLKPENIMLTSDGTPKILDFGLVKNAPVGEITNAPTTPQVTAAGLVLGTASYMSPEQARGETVDFRTDHFSFGVILHEMATGKNPFRRATAVETLAAILNDEAPPLSDEFPQPFLWIVERCLAKDCAERYGSTADLAYDLRRFSMAPAIPPAYAANTATGRWWITAMVIVAALIVGVALMRRQRSNGALPLEVAVAVPPVEQITFGEISPPVTISPDGRYLVIDGAGSDGVDRLWIHDLRSDATHPIAETEHAYGIAFSPDSRSIAFAAAGKLKIIAFDGGPPTILCDATPPGQVTWSGDTILFSTTAGIFRISAHGGAPHDVLVNGTSDALLWPQFLPDGHHFFYLSTKRINGNINHDLMVCSLDDAAPKRIAALDSRVVFSDGDLLFVREGTLLAQPFDSNALRFTGEPRPLLDHLFYFRSTGLAAFTVSDNGLLAWRSDRPASRQVWLDRVGMESGAVGSAIFSGGRLSPDGSRYAAGLIDPKEGTSDIWIYDLTRQNAQRLTFRLTEESNPVWSPDGRTLFYRCDVLGPPDIFRWNLGEDHGTLVYHGPGVKQPEDVAPDGKSMLFDSFSRILGTRSIFVLPLDPAGKPQSFDVAPFNEVSPRFSPDGRWVAYQSDASGRPEIYIRSFRGGLATRISKDGGTKPRWRRDGKELFFLARGGRLMSVPMSGGASTTAPKILFQASDAVDFEPAGNGSRFLVQFEQPSLEPPVHLLINWPARLKAQP